MADLASVSRRKRDGTWRPFVLATLIIFAPALAGCQLFRPTAAEVCEGEAPAYEGEVVGAFDTTVGAIRGLEPRDVEPARWPNLSDGHPAVLCYIDGQIAKSPPGGEPFDRAVIAVVDEQADMIAAGYRARLPIRAP